MVNWQKWDARGYLEDYHAEVARDAQLVMKFLAEAVGRHRDEIDPSSVLDFGCGPTLYGALSVGHHFEEIYLADYLADNLSQIDRWIKASEGMFDWTPHTRFVLGELLQRPGGEEVVRRYENGIRSKVTSLLTGDAYRRDPLGRMGRGRFPVVLSLFCADSITDDRNEWAALLRNIYSLVAPGGFFVMGALIGCASYRVGAERIPSANLSVLDCEGLLRQLDLRPRSLELTSYPVPEHASLGYRSILLAPAIWCGQRS